MPESAMNAPGEYDERLLQGLDYLLVEMGARGAGHLTYLTGIAPPDIAVVLNVGSAHVGEFGSRAAPTAE